MELARAFHAERRNPIAGCKAAHDESSGGKVGVEAGFVKAKRHRCSVSRHHVRTKDKTRLRHLRYALAQERYGKPDGGSPQEPLVGGFRMVLDYERGVAPLCAPSAGQVERGAGRFADAEPAHVVDMAARETAETSDSRRKKLVAAGPVPAA